MYQRVNRKQEVKKTALHPVTVRFPWHKVGIDLVTVPETSEIGNKYILTVVDYFTKFAQARPAKDEKADTVAKCLCDTSAKYDYIRISLYV